jgi:hypothetical protein
MKARLLLSAAAALLIVAIACGGSPTRPSQTTSPPPPAQPTQPAPQPASISGDWTGTSVDSQGTTVVNWTIAQSGSDVAGTVTTRAPDPADGSCNACHRNKSGTFTGTIAGDVLTLTLTFAAGVNGDPTPICSATMTGSASRIAAGDLSGVYTGSDTCEGPFLDGRLTMSRRQ